MKKMNPDFEKYLEESSEAWDSRELGASEEHVSPSSIEDIQVSADAALTMKMTSIRLSQDMIDDLKDIARIHGFRGYQTLMKNVLERFVEMEKKQLLRDAALTHMKAAVDTSECKTNGDREKVA